MERSPPPTREPDSVPPAALPNFAFLAYHDPRLVVLGTQAARYFTEDPNTCLVKLRQFGEILARRAAARLGPYTLPDDNQDTLINRLRERGALDATTQQLFHDLRSAGNKAAHELAPAAVIQAAVERAAEAAQGIHLDEAVTRRIIDEQLRDRRSS